MHLWRPFCASLTHMLYVFARSGFLCKYQSDASGPHAIEISWSWMILRDESWPNGAQIDCCGNTTLGCQHLDLRNLARRHTFSWFNSFCRSQTWLDHVFRHCDILDFCLSHNIWWMAVVACSARAPVFFSACYWSLLKPEDDEKSSVDVWPVFHWRYLAFLQCMLSSWTRSTLYRKGAHTSMPVRALVLSHDDCFSFPFFVLILLTDLYFGILDPYNWYFLYCMCCVLHDVERGWPQVIMLSADSLSKSVTITSPNRGCCCFSSWELVVPFVSSHVLFYSVCLFLPKTCHGTVRIHTARYGIFLFLEQSP